jgi:glutamate formiminotransferase
MASTEFSIPTDPNDLRKLKNAIETVAADKQMVADRNEAARETAKEMKDQFGLPVKMFNQLVKAYHKQEYAEMSMENATFEAVYETLFEVGTSSDDEEAA